MYFSIGRCLKALLIVCSLGGGAASALDANKADIGLNTTINGNNVMQVTINSGGQGCSAGQYWDIGVGVCTSEVLLRSVSVTKFCSCDCGASATGSCSAQQDGSYQVFGWRLPTAGNELISRNGPTTWGSCYTISNSCVAIPTGPSPPTGTQPGAPGTTIAIVTNDLICDSSNPNYPEGGATAFQKNSIIAAYRQHSNGFGRCPESNYAGFAGWSYWQSKLTVDGWSIADVVDLIKTSSVTDAEVRTVLKAACTVAANKAYGVGYVSATYIMGSGNGCTVLF